MRNPVSLSWIPAFQKSTWAFGAYTNPDYSPLVKEQSRCSIIAHSRYASAHLRGTECQPPWGGGHSVKPLRYCICSEWSTNLWIEWAKEFISKTTLSVIPACLESFLKKDAGQASMTEHLYACDFTYGLISIFPLWKRGMKGDLKNKCFHLRIIKSPQPPLSKRGIFGSISNPSVERGMS